jgi:Flp pilus assembly pilin Flp
MQRLIRRSGRKGQGLVEYILVVFLMGIVCIGVVKGLSHSTKDGFEKATEELDDAFRGD